MEPLHNQIFNNQDPKQTPNMDDATNHNFDNILESIKNLNSHSNKQRRFGHALTAAILLACISIAGLTIQRYQFETRLNEIAASAESKITAVIQNQRLALGPREPMVAAKVDLKLPAEAPILGNPGAKVAIVEFADFQCPFCERFFTEIEPQLKSEFIDTGKANFSYQHFAFLGPESLTAGQAAECAKDQGKFWEMHDAIYKAQNGENQGTFSAAKMQNLASKIQLDKTVFQTCMKDLTTKDKVIFQTQFGKTLGVSGTPTVFINGTRLIGMRDYQEFKTAIEAALLE